MSEPMPKHDQRRYSRLAEKLRERTRSHERRVEVSEWIARHRESLLCRKAAP